MSTSGNITPEEILALWEKVHFPLSESLRAQFLTHPTMIQLITFDYELVASAICEEKIKKLDNVLKFLDSPIKRNENLPKPRFRMARQYFREAMPPLGDYFGDGSNRTYEFSDSIYEFEYEKRDFPEGEVLEYQKKSREGTLCHLCGGRVEKGRCNCSHT